MCTTSSLLSAVAGEVEEEIPSISTWASLFPILRKANIDKRTETQFQDPHLTEKHFFVWSLLVSVASSVVAFVLFLIWELIPRL